MSARQTVSSTRPRKPGGGRYFAPASLSFGAAMAENPYYDLMVLLDPDSPEESRTQVIDQVRSQVSGRRRRAQGRRRLGPAPARLRDRPPARGLLPPVPVPGPADLLETLDRNLSIDDAVLRHRIIRLPGEPPAEVPKPEPTAAPVSEARRSSAGRSATAATGGRQRAVRARDGAGRPRRRRGAAPAAPAAAPAERRRRRGAAAGGSRRAGCRSARGARRRGRAEHRPSAERRARAGRAERPNRLRPSNRPSNFRVVITSAGVRSRRAAP